MPASWSDPTRPRLRRDEQGVSEVVGHMLVFGIISILLVVSMVSFNDAQEATRNRIIGLRADSAASRVAGLVVQAALVAERHGTLSNVTFPADLDPQLEGFDYTVGLEPAAGSVPALVRVRVPAEDIDTTAALFAADAPAAVEVCAGTVSGGLVVARFGLNPSTGTRCLFLENA